MVKLRADEQELVIDIKTLAGKSLANMVVQAVYLYATNCEEGKAIVAQLGRMVVGDETAVDVDLNDYSQKEETSC